MRAKVHVFLKPGVLDVQRVLDRLALHVEDARLEEHVNLGAH